jgi:SAM-dependent methyltransferase
MGLSINTKLQTNYENYYAGESEWRRRGAIDKVANIVRLCGDFAHQEILEIGSGEGAILARMSELGFGKSLYGLEVSGSAVEATHERQIPTLVECRVFEGYSIPYADRRFDIAVLSHVVEHLEHPRQLLYEAARVAKLVFVEVPLEDTVRLTRDYVFDPVGHINFYSPKTIRRLLQTCELDVISQQITNSSRPVYQYRMGAVRGAATHLVKQSLLYISQALATRLLTYNCSLLCTKSRPQPL